jgi:glycosyltransferase involved in cell wall biosynthesis
MKDLAYKFRQANLYIHPSLYHETFGRVFTECMASGCLPVALNNGANKEIIEDYGYVIDYPNIYNSEAFDSFIDKIVELLGKDLSDKRIEAEKAMYKWDYMNLSKKLDDIIQER